MGDDTPDDHSPLRETNSQSRTASDESVSETADASPLSPGSIFGFLADERRRYVLYALQANGGKIHLDDVVEQVAAWENETTAELLTKDMKQRVRTTLHHTDLPKLETHDIIQYDAASGTVSFATNASQIDHYVEFAKRVEETEELDGVTQPEPRDDV